MSLCNSRPQPYSKQLSLLHLLVFLKELLKALSITESSFFMVDVILCCWCEISLNLLERSESVALLKSILVVKPPFIFIIKQAKFAPVALDFAVAAPSLLYEAYQ